MVVLLVYEFLVGRYIKSYSLAKKNYSNFENEKILSTSTAVIWLIQYHKTIYTTVYPTVEPLVVSCDKTQVSWMNQVKWYIIKSEVIVYQCKVLNPMITFHRN